MGKYIELIENISSDHIQIHYDKRLLCKNIIRIIDALNSI